MYLKRVLSVTTLGRTAEASVFSAAFYALHPLRVECLHWLSAHPYIYSGCFTLCALNLHLVLHTRRGDHSTVTIRALTFLCAALAVLSKSASLCLPLALILLRAFIYPPAPAPPPTPSLSALPTLLPFVAATALVLHVGGALPASGALAVQAVSTAVSLRPPVEPERKPGSSRGGGPTPSFLRHLGAGIESLVYHQAELLASAFALCRAAEATLRDAAVQHRAPTPFLPFNGLTAPQRVVKACYSLVWYLAQTLAPTGLAFHYLLDRDSFDAKLPWLIPATAVVTGVSASLLYWGYLRPLPLTDGPRTTPRLVDCLAVSWFAFIFLLLPSLGLVNHGPHYWAGDRYR
jgi:hypothetical protein